MMPTLLDLRLMMTRQPFTALCLGVVIVLTTWLLRGPSDIGSHESNGGIDPARLVAAQRNFQAILIPSSGLAKAQQALLESATSHQLTIGQVEYAQETEAESGFVRSSMIFPVTGRYVDIRTFIESALAKQPALLIRHLNIQHESAAEENSALKATLTAHFLIGRG